MANLPPIIPASEFEAAEAPASTAQAAQAAPTGLPDVIPASEFESEEEAYTTPGQQLKALGEGAAEAATFGASTAIERKVLGVKPEDIAGRREHNPIPRAVGQVVGLAGTPGGAAKVLHGVGEAAAAVAGFGEATALAKIGSAAVRGAAETALLQGGDEVAKMLASDPHQTAGTALADIGLSSVLGGTMGAGFGALSPVWKATMGGKLARTLDAVANRANGTGSVVSADMDAAIARTGMELPPEIRAGLSHEPELQQYISTLNQSDTSHAGMEFQETMKNFRKDTGDVMVRALGAEPETIGSKEFSRYETGKTIGHTLADEINTKVSPLSAEYEAIKDKFGRVPLTPDQVIEHRTPVPPDANQLLHQEPAYTITRESIPGLASQTAEKIAALAKKEGWTISPSSDVMREVRRVLTELPQVKTFADLGNYIKQVGNNMQADPLNGPLKRAGGLIKKILSEVEYKALVDKVGAESGQEAAMRLALVREAYSAQSELKEAIDSRLHIGGSTSGYAKAVQEMAQTDGEKLLNRLSGKNDADLLSTLAEHFPQTAEAMKRAHLDQVLDTAARKAKPDETISTSALRKALDGMSPELRDFVVPKAAQERINSIGTILDHFNKLPHNHSNTARTLDKLMANLPASALSMVSLLTGHNPATSFLVGQVGGFLGKHAPDAAKLGLLKFLGSTKPVSGEGFKAMVDYVARANRGELVLNKAAKAIFESSKTVLPTLEVPKHKIEKLREHVEKLSADATPLLNTGGALGHYLDDHGAAMAETAQNAVNYLASQKPQDVQAGALDRPIPPSPARENDYERTLTIAEQPLTILAHLKEGKLRPKDLQDLQALYPAMMPKLAAKVGQELITHMSTEKVVPYKLRRGLSMLLGQPVDSSFSPASFMAVQAAHTFGAPPPPQGQPGKPKSGSTTKLGKTAELTRTPNEARQANLSS